MHGPPIGVAWASTPISTSLPCQGSTALEPDPRPEGALWYGYAQLCPQHSPPESKWVSLSHLPGQQVPQMDLATTTSLLEYRTPSSIQPNLPKPYFSFSFLWGVIVP